MAWSPNSNAWSKSNSSAASQSSLSVGSSNDSSFPPLSLSSSETKNGEKSRRRNDPFAKPKLNPYPSRADQIRNQAKERFEIGSPTKKSTSNFASFSTDSQGDVYYPDPDDDDDRTDLESFSEPNPPATISRITFQNQSRSQDDADFEYYDNSLQENLNLGPEIYARHNQPHVKASKTKAYLKQAQIGNGIEEKETRATSKVASSAIDLEEIRQRLSELQFKQQTSNLDFQDLSQLNQESLLKLLLNCERESRLNAIQSTFTSTSTSTSLPAESAAFQRLRSIILITFGSIDGMVRSFGRVSESETDANQQNQTQLDLSKFRSLLSFQESLPRFQLDWLRPMILDGIEILSLATILELRTEGEDAEIDFERVRLISEAFMVAIEILESPNFHDSGVKAHSLTCNILSILSRLLQDPSLRSHLLKMLSNANSSNGYPLPCFKSILQRILGCMGSEVGNCLKKEEERKAMKSNSTIKGKGKAREISEEGIPFHCRNQILKDASCLLDLLWIANGSRENSDPNLESSIPLAASDFYLTISDLAPILQDLKIQQIFNSSKAKQSSTMPIFTFTSHPYLLTLGGKSRLFSSSIKRSILHDSRKAEDSLWSGSREVDTLEDSNQEELLSENGRLKIVIRREKVVEDSISELRKHFKDSQFKMKDLEIKFQDEEGFDSGGLKREWFMILSEELSQELLFETEEGQVYLDSNAIDDGSLDKFEVLGKLLALALIHDQLLGIELPWIVFEFIMSKDDFSIQSLQHGRVLLNQIQPSIARSLWKVLDWKEESTFKDAFDLDWTWNGEVELIPSGKDTKVDMFNRRDYVLEVINYLLVDSVKQQLLSVKHGFNLVLPSQDQDHPINQSLNLFSSDEFSLLFSGSVEALPIDLLRASSTHSNFRNTPEDFELIQGFWECLEEEGRDLWRFITGMSRLPAIGRAGINLVAVDGGRLPSSSTCTNTIFLPRGREIKEKLQMAIRGSRGFGLK